MRIRLKISIFSLWLIAALSSYSQNLIPNGSFETYTACPFFGGEIYYATPWIDPSNNTSDYFHPCCSTMNFTVPNSAVGYQAAYNGVAYGGIAAFYLDEESDTTYREYIQVPLTSTLSLDSCYQLKYYVSIAEQGKYGINSLSAYFSATPISCTNCYFTNLPQITSDPSLLVGDTIGWTMLEGVFKSQGNENHLTIGNFKTHSSTIYTIISSSMNEGAYYFIDSVSLIKVTCPIDIGIDENENVKPFKLFPNPNNGNMSFQYMLKANDKAEIHIYDITGKLINSYLLNSNATQKEIHTELINSGIYFYTISVNSQPVQSDKLIIIK